MEIKMKVNKKWSVDYKTRTFLEGYKYDLPEKLGEKMISAGYAEDAKMNQPEEPESKAGVVPENKALAFTAENKAITSTEENKGPDTPKKRGPKPKK